MSTWTVRAAFSHSGHVPVPFAIGDVLSFRFLYDEQQLLFVGLEPGRDLSAG
jgi:hypothetical protein